MPEYIIKPGMKMHVPSVEEIVQPMHDRILKSLGKNAAFTRLVEQSNTNAAGKAEFKLGPQNGFTWDIRAVVVYMGNVTATGLVGYDNVDNQPVNAMGLWTSQTPLFYNKQFILHSGQQMHISNLGTGVAGAFSSPVAIAIAVVEVPTEHIAQLLL
jgi:hypothetical protein